MKPTKVLYRIVQIVMVAGYAFLGWTHWPDAGYTMATIWIFLYFVQSNMSYDWQDIARQALQGWKECLDSGEEMIKEVEKLRAQNAK